jgi:ubiquinone/menaquinone biosynthesis C-methylase UbiE
LHHTPNTEKAISEAVRVLKPGGILKMMVYHVTSWSAWIMWLLALAKGELTTPRKAIYKYLESPGTKAYTVREARKILEALPLADIAIEPRLAQSDLMDIMPSERHDNRAFYIAKSLYPRPIVRLLGDRFGLNLFIEARRTAG